MDFTLFRATHYGHMSLLPRLTLYYDIICQYGVHLVDRLRIKRIPLPNYTTFLRGIGIWHVHGHVRRCYHRHCALFVPGAGIVDGEIVETIWAELNRVARNTQHMTLPNRSEALDAHMNDINLSKILRSGENISLHFTSLLMNQCSAIVGCKMEVR